MTYAQLFCSPTGSAPYQRGGGGSGDSGGATARPGRSGRVGGWAWAPVPRTGHSCWARRGRQCPPPAPPLFSPRTARWGLLLCAALTAGGVPVLLAAGGRGGSSRKGWGEVGVGGVRRRSRPPPPGRGATPRRCRAPGLSPAPPLGPPRLPAVPPLHGGREWPGGCGAGDGGEVWGMGGAPTDPPTPTHTPPPISAERAVAGGGGGWRGGGDTLVPPCPRFAPPASAGQAPTGPFRPRPLRAGGGRRVGAPRARGRSGLAWRGHPPHLRETLQCPRGEEPPLLDCAFPSPARLDPLSHRRPPSPPLAGHAHPLWFSGTPVTRRAAAFPQPAYQARPRGHRTRPPACRHVPPLDGRCLWGSCASPRPTGTATDAGRIQTIRRTPGEGPTPPKEHPSCCLSEENPDPPPKLQFIKTIFVAGSDMILSILGSEHFSARCTTRTRDESASCSTVCYTF